LRAPSSSRPPPPASGLSSICYSNASRDIILRSVFFIPPLAVLYLSSCFFKVVGVVALELGFREARPSAALDSAFAPFFHRIPLTDLCLSPPILIAPFQISQYRTCTQSATAPAASC
ncbi:hypothetical protein FA15DRAFT_675222, partial [Coprinopsis marcescibilis]